MAQLSPTGGRSGRFSLQTPGWRNRNPFAGGVPPNPIRTVPGNSKYFTSRTSPAGVTTWSAGNKSAPRRGGGGGGDGGEGLAPIPSVTTPNVLSSIPLAGMMQKYLPQDVVQRATNNRIAQLQQAASVGPLAERMAGNQGNFGSISSGQNMPTMMKQAMPYAQQAAMVGAQAPVEAALQRYEFGTQGLGAQADEVFGQTGLDLRRQREMMDRWRREFALKDQIARMLA